MFSSQDSLFVLGQFGFQVIRTNRNTLGSYIIVEQCGPVSSPRFFIAVATAFALLFTEHRYVQFDFTALLYAPSNLLSWDGRQTAQHTSLDGHTNKVPAYWGHFSVFSMYIIYFSKSSSWLLKPNKRKTQTCFSIQPEILILIQNQ